MFAAHCRRCFHMYVNNLTYRLHNVLALPIHYPFHTFFFHCTLLFGNYILIMLLCGISNHIYHITAVQDERAKTRDPEESTDSIADGMPVDKILEAELLSDPKPEDTVKFQEVIFIL